MNIAIGAYRAAILPALQEVENNSEMINQLLDEANVRPTSDTAALRTEDLVFALCQNSALSFLDVVTVETAAPQAHQTAHSIVIRKLQVTAALVRAIGGG